MDHQDWNVVSFKSNHKPRQRGERAVNEAIRTGQQVEGVRKQRVNQQHSGPSNYRQLAETNDVVPTKTIGHDFKMAMQKARTAAGLSQKDLATRVNEKQGVISDYESGRAIPNPGIISKIERVLGCHLPRPKKEQRQKQEEDYY